MGILLRFVHIANIQIAIFPNLLPYQTTRAPARCMWWLIIKNSVLLACRPHEDQPCHERTLHTELVLLIPAS